MTHPKVKYMRKRLGKLLDLALKAQDEREADKILRMYEQGKITRSEAIRRLRKLTKTKNN